MAEKGEDKDAERRDALPPAEVERRAMDAARRLLTTPKPSAGKKKGGEPKPAAPAIGRSNAPRPARSKTASQG